MSRKLKLAALQKRIGSYIPPAEFHRLHELGVDLVCLPEYFFIPDGTRNQIETTSHRQTILSRLAAYSRELVGAVVGGTLVEEEEGRYYNACHIFDCGQHIGFYRKRHLTGREQALDLKSGEGPAVFELRGFRLGVLICADVLLAESYRELAPLKADVIAVPTVSPYLENDTVAEKHRRDQEYFVKGARLAGAYVVKACGVGSLMGGRLQGRSLICSPAGIITRVTPRNEMLESTLIAEVDLDKLPGAVRQNNTLAAPELFLLPGPSRT